MSFKKMIENFICEYCAHENIGTGFTNHCEQCLWSKHVDVDPGDRKETCAGMMEPWDVEPKNGGFRIVHKCTKCTFLRPSPFLMEDSVEAFGVTLRTAAKRKEDLLR